MKDSEFRALLKVKIKDSLGQVGKLEAHLAELTELARLMDRVDELMDRVAELERSADGLGDDDA
jgi:hypothetical protein